MFHSTNRPLMPGAIIGYRKNGAPIRLIVGGSVDVSDAGTGSQDAAESGDTGQQDNGDGDAGSGGSARDDQGRFASRDDPEHTARTVAAIREDFKTERGKRQAAEKELAAVKKAQADLQAAIDADKAEQARRMDALAIALGLKSGDEPPDPEKLAAELKAAQDKAQADIAQRDAAIRQSRVELAVLRNAGRHGASGDALLDSRSFMAKVSGLDPAADSFDGDLAEAIKAALENGPQYKASAPQPPAEGRQNGAQAAGAERKPPAPSRSGGEHTAPGGNRQWTLADVEAASPSEVVAAQDQGLLTDLGYPPRKKTR